MMKKICCAFILFATIVSLSGKENNIITNLDINHQNNSIVDTGDGEEYIIEVDFFDNVKRIGDIKRIVIKLNDKHF